VHLHPAILGRRVWFPDPHEAVRIGPYEGIVAVGGDLSQERLLLAYRQGIFPWTGDPLTWWSPDPRGVFELDRFHVPHSLRRVLRQAPFRVTRDAAFPQVIRECAAPAPGRMTTWISPQFIDAYCQLHRAGHAHSVECWHEDQLAGGIYGVSLGGLFAGESMFSRASNASKVALFHLVQHLRQQGFLLFDIQVLTQVTRSLGAIAIPREEYLRRLEQAVHADAKF
jgi:leucyl/phenylalanyl-tRNA--protein transferase